MRRLRIGTLVAFVVVLLTAAAAQAQERPRIAVIPFDNRTDWWAESMGEVAADMLVTRLVSSGQFVVIERERLDAILQEQGFQLSGQVNPDDVVEIGRLAGVMYMITGAVTSFTIDEVGTRVLGRSVGYTEAESEMNVRAISTETGEVVMATEGSGSKRLVNISGVISMSSMDRGVAEDALGPASDEVAQAILDQHDRFPVTAVAGPAAPPASIVGSAADGSIYIDQGENLDVQVGQRYEVMRVVDEIVNAAGDVLDVITDRVGVIEVTRVLSQSAIASVVEGEAAEGDTLRRVE